MCRKLICLASIVLVLGLVVPSVVNAASLVGWWQLDGNLQDSSGLGNHGTAVGDPTFVAGKIGSGAIDLDGDDFVTIDGVADDIIRNDVTLSGWVRLSFVKAYHSVLPVNTATGGNVMMIEIDNGEPYIYEMDGGQCYTGVQVIDDQWHLLTYTRSGDSGTLYVDAVPEGTHDASSYYFSVDDRWSIGQEWDGDSPSDFTVGLVDDVHIYNRALTTQQVEDLFNGIHPTWPKASYPVPADGAKDLTEVLLEWEPGTTAVSHDVYFGTSKTNVTAGTGGTSKGNQTETSFDPSPLLPGITYYWRIDEKAADATVTTGDVWSFQMAEYLVVDDFEDYNDYCNRIFYTWPDGWGYSGDATCGVAPYGGNGSGSTVGNLDPPYAEQTIVHGGNQAMMMQYDNSSGTYLSWTERTFETAQDFTAGGLLGLTLWYQGQPASVGSLGYDAGTQTYTITSSGSDIAGTSDEFHYAFKQLTGDGSVIAKVESLTDTDSWAKAGVMIRETLDANSINAAVVVTPSGRVAFQFREFAGQGTVSSHTGSGAITAPHWVRLTRTGNILTAEHSTNGSTWVDVESSDPDDPVQSQWAITMKPTVYVGLAVTAHDAKATCEATFSNVTVAGVIPGPFTESQDVGIGSNSPQKLYVTLEDNAGTPGTVYHEDGTDAVLASDYQMWAIPLADFQDDGVDVTAVKKMTIGVGDKDNPQPDGTGKIYVDDIQVVRRMPAVGLVLFTEDFEGLTLGPNVDEAVAGDEVWTKTGPAGWTIDDSGVPGAGDPANDGVTEWAGWSFADKAWWVEAAGDQQRSDFILASGNVALVDPDEWDDLPRTPGLLNSFLSTPPIDVSAVKAGTETLRLQFDSSWRQEDTQTANVTVSFDGGDPIEVMRWESAGGDPTHFKADATSETVTVKIDRPAGAKEMVITFGMLDAGNDWWWAIDNVEVSGPPRERVITFTEDFEGLTLGPNVDEGVAGNEVWTETPPAGWTMDDSGVPGAGDPASDGVTEWAGWGFADKDWWVETAGDQQRSQFELGNGTVAIADPDEWDDAFHAAGYYNARMSTLAIDVSGFEPGSLQLKFDSSWRPYANQTGVVTVEYDGGGAAEVLRWESQAGLFYKTDTTSETVTVPLDNPVGTTSAVISFGLLNAGNDWWWAIDNLEVSALPRERATVLSEDFEGLQLGPNVDEGTPGEYPEAWTDTPPPGWTIDDSGVPMVPGDPDNDGVTEWAGWSFADKDFWLSADLQRREEFALGDGTVAIADSDEFDDKSHPSGSYNTFLTTAGMDISGIEAGSLELTFDSSWRPESNQKANIMAQFDGGAPVEVLRWESNSGSPNYHGHETNETVTVPINNPEGAESMILTFGYFDASNNWWWAIDNVVVSGYPKSEAIVRIFAENFNGVTLTPSVDEEPSGVWTKTPPPGWTIDDSGVPGAGDPANDGVTEWAGWSFANKQFWIETDYQNRQQFDLGQGTVAVADCDEWDDAPHAEGYYNTFLDTLAIDISGVEAGTIELKFDSSWRPEYDDYYHQTGDIAVAFDGGEWVGVLRWESDPASADFKPDATNETVTVTIPNPAGAQSMVISFGLFDAGNDWWWAIDNVQVTGTSGGSVVTLLSEDFEGLPLGPSVEEAPPPKVWTDEPPEGWLVDDSGVPGAGDPANDGVTEWAGWSFTNKAWWVGVAGDQQRSEFEKGREVVAVADPDEWDDMAHAEGMYNALLSTPAIDISGVEACSLQLTFDSSWREEVTQTASVTVSYDGGAPIEVLRWESAGGDPAYFKADATNETVSVKLNNPAGASAMVITFGLLNAGNNWWWAIDDVVVNSIVGVEEPLAGDFNSDCIVGFADFAILGSEWQHVGAGPQADITADGKVDEDDLAAFCDQWLAQP